MAARRLALLEPDVVQMNASGRLIAMLFLGGLANKAYGEDLAVLKGFEFSPTVTTRYSYDDNVNKSSSAQMSDTYLTVLPMLRLASGLKHLRYSLLAGGDYGFYSKQSDLDYEKHMLNATGEFTSGRYAVNAAAIYERSQDDVGVSGSGSTISKPVYWQRTSGEGGARLGTGLARLTVATKINASGIRYDDAQSQWRNRNNNEAELSSFINLSGKTTASLSAKRTDILYQYAGAARNNSEYLYSVSAEWQGTAKTNGRIEFGLQNKGYTNPLLDGYTGLYTEISIDWQRKSYSTFHAAYSRRTQESADKGDLFFVRNNLGITMNHALTHRWMVSGNITGDINEVANGRTDYFAATDLGIKLRAHRWISLELTFQQSLERSTLAGYGNYDATTAGLNLTLNTRSWINGGLSVQHSRWRSIVPNANYDATTISVNLGISPRKK